MTELECKPYGIGYAEEGVCLLVRVGPYRILLDCGLLDISPLMGIVDELDFVWCSHAHPDHAKGLLALHRASPQLPIYASEVTTQLLPLSWPGETVHEFCQALPWRSPVELRAGLSAVIVPAGHLPGAAVLLLSCTMPKSMSSTHPTYTLMYTGDFCLSNTRMVDGLPLDELRGLHPDVLILEGSYGTARFPRRRQQENQLVERVSQALNEGTSVLLPLPALGLAQELLLILRSHHLFTGRDVDIWVDDPIAAACELYLQILPQLPVTVQNFARHQSLFLDERIRPHVRRLREIHHSNLGVRTPCVILADITQDWSQFCRAIASPWLILWPQRPGYPSTQPLLQDVASDPSKPLSVESYLLVEHCDGAGTTQLIHNLRPQHVLFIHGSPTYLADLAGLDELYNRYHLHIPATGTLVELPIGETFHQPAAPETSYEGELTEIETLVTITLPSAITTDPRWQQFADTGLIEARWQGDELVLRGLSQQEVLLSGDRPTARLDSDFPQRAACENCRYYRGQHCSNQASPLFGFKVTPDGYCLAYQSRRQTTSSS